MPSPQMIGGMRQPQSVRLEDMRKSTEAAFAPVTSALAPEGVTVYISSSRGYLVEVSNVPSFVHDGRRIPAKRIAAQFVEGIYRNNHRDPKTRALIDEALQTNPYFGKFNAGPQVHFWLASEQFAVVEKARVNSAFNTLKSLPRETVEQFVAELQQGDSDDHVVSAPAAEAKPAQRPTKPIATT